MIIEGTIAVKFAILYEKRRINQVYVDREKKKDRNFAYILKLLENKQINYHLIARESFQQFTSSKTHGGMIAIVEKRQNDCLESLLKQEVIFCLNGMEDPYNYAYSIRTLCALGYESILTEKRDYFESEASILKSSAGAFDRVNIHQSDDIDSCISYFRKNGYRIIALQRSETSKDLYQQDYAGKLLVIIGGERRGIRKSTLALVDKEIIIPYGSDFRNALNATSALAMMAGEIFRKRKYR